MIRMIWIRNGVDHGRDWAFVSLAKCFKSLLAISNKTMHKNVQLFISLKIFFSKITSNANLCNHSRM